MVRSNDNSRYLVNEIVNVYVSKIIRLTRSMNFESTRDSVSSISIVVNSNERGSAKMTPDQDKRKSEEIANILKACILTQKGGVPQEELDDLYFKLTGTYIPYLSLGYPSLYQYMRTFTDIHKKRNENQELVYTVNTPKTAHIASLVERQKDARDTNTGSRGRFARSNNINGNNRRIRSTTYYNNNNNNDDECTNGKWKRKATNDGRRGRRMEKRRKEEGRMRLREWNQIYDRTSSSEEGNNGDCQWNISEAERWYNDEYNHPVKIMEKQQKMDVVFEPIVNGKQLIGDDFFLQLAIRNLGMAVWRKGPCTALHSGLCISGQTIKECTQTLKKVQVLSSRLVIMLGAEDIYRGHSCEKMIEDMEDLLDYLEARFAFSRSAITLCTLPPLANLSLNCHRAQLATLQSFNSWIREQTNVGFNKYHWDSNLHYNLIEFYHNNTNAKISTAYQYFQLDARMVSGSPHPYVLWNIRGRRLAMSMLGGGHYN